MSESHQLELKTTPLTQWHVDHGARMVNFAGYQMPVQYSSILAEHAATRNAAALFDISHMGRLRFEGPRAHELLDYLLTRRVTDIPTGAVRYSLMCNEMGGVLDDVLISNLETPSSRHFFLLVVNASNREKIVKWIGPHLADYPDVVCNDVTESTAMIAVQGPRSAEIVGKLFAPRVVELAYYRALVVDQMHKPCIISRTGYTGEDGFELIVRAEDAGRVWENLLLAGRQHAITAAGLGARDTLRLEAAMPLYGHELSEEMDPITCGLGFAVNLKDRVFIGREALENRRSRPLGVKRIGLRLAGKRAAREGASLIDSDGRTVGHVTSGTFSPTLQYPIAMGYIASELAIEGTAIDVDIRGSKATAEIVTLPFYRRV
ncbi:MAG: glycine cleavage system aminomethyltransferase GcvT [Planctomycetales bacterium]|nr:glycine cleavage system aminomethyltransferase GcvT [Planctomycetales bacterium]